MRVFLAGDGACLARPLGHRVVCVDKDGGKIAGLRTGRLPLYEPGLKELVGRGLRRKRLSFSGELSEAVDDAEVLFIGVDTRQNGDGSADLSSVAAVARGIGRALAEANRERPLVVANKSTVPVGSGDYVSMLIRDGIDEVAHAAVIVTEWEEARSVDLSRVSTLMRYPKLLVDGRNVLGPREASGAGTGVTKAGATRRRAPLVPSGTGCLGNHVRESPLCASGKAAAVLGRMAGSPCACAGGGLWEKVLE